MQTSVHKVRRTYMQYRGWFFALTDRDRQGTDSDLSCAGFFFFFFFSFLFFFFFFRTKLKGHIPGHNLVRRLPSLGVWYLECLWSRYFVDVLAKERLDVRGETQGLGHWMDRALG